MLIRNLMATTALTALVVATGAYAQTTQPAGQQKQERQANQPQQEVSVSDGATVIIQADGQTTDVRLRIQSAAGERGAPNAQVDNSTAPRQQGAEKRPAQQGSDVRDRTKMQSAKGPFSANDLMGTDIYSQQDEKIGSISDILLTKEGEVDAVVVKIGGFLGMGGREVAFGIDDIEMMSDGQGNVYAYTDYSRQQLAGAPKYDKASWGDNRDQQRMTKEMARNLPAEQPAQSRAGGTHVVEPGGTIIVGSDQDKFQLNFQVRQSEKDQARRAGPTEPRAKPGGVQGQRQARAPAETGVQTRAPADQGQRQVIDTKQLRASDLIGARVYGANDANVGTVGDVLLTGDGGFDAVIVDVGGFLGMGTREVALGLDDVQFMRDRQNRSRIQTHFTRAQIEAAPKYDPATYKDQRDQQRLAAPRN